MQDKRVGMVPIKCGLCMECAAARSAEWKSRLLEEVKHQKQKGNFVTFTFSNESYTELREEAIKKNPELKGYDLDNQIATIAIHKWRERWRKHNKKSPRHWFITELGHGETEHLHLHGLVWTDTPGEIAYCSISCSNSKRDSEKTVATLKETIKRKQDVVRDEQLTVYHNLAEKLKRNPMKAEWVQACKEAGVS